MTSFRKVLERGVLSKMKVLSFSVNGQEGGFSEMHGFLHVQAMIKCEKMRKKTRVFRRGFKILKWGGGGDFCNNVIEPKPGWGVWGLCISMIEEGLRKRGGGGWKFTHFTSPGSAPGIDNKPSKLTWKREVSSVWRRFRPLELTKRRVEKYAKTQVKTWAFRCVSVFCCCCC